MLPRTVLIGTAFAGTLLLAGCSGGGATSGHTAAQEKKVTADLATIDSGLGGKDTLTDVKAICIQMQKHASDAALQAEVKAHFADHSISTMSGAEIAQIISTIKTDYCS